MPERLPLKNTICVTNRLLLVFLARSCEFEPIVTRLDGSSLCISVSPCLCGDKNVSFTTELPRLLEQADNEMKLWQCSNNGLGCDDLQVEKAVAPLARLCPPQSLVSGMASITLVNYPFSEVANIPLRRMRILTSLRLQANQCNRSCQNGQA